MINSMVRNLIDRRGYYSVIGKLVSAAYNFGEISLADPKNGAKLRRFDIWAQAVTMAIVNHDLKANFEGRLTDSDRRFAAEMRIWLD